MSKTDKKPRSEKQLANDKRLREMALKRAEEKRKAKEDTYLEEDFEPAEVKNKKKEAEVDPAQAVQSIPVNTAEQVEIPAPADMPVQPVPQFQAVDPALITSVAIAVAQALQQNPQLQSAAPEQKLDILEQSQNRQGQHSARVGANGIQGVFEKHSVREEDYPSPVPRLMKEPKIQRFAPQENFIFRWAVDGIQYERNGITYSEPRFTIELLRRLFDEDTGEPTNRAALVARNILHEDEFTTKAMARELDVISDYDNSDEGFKALMNEMRYQRIRQWMLALFAKPEVETHNRRPTTQVIEGKVVEVFDTERLTSGEGGISKASVIESQTGAGKIATPEGKPK